MFSIMTMASSTTKPVPIVSAMSERLSSENPQNHMMPKVAMIDSGSATPAMMVARMVRRKISTTVMTNATLRISVNCTSRTEARMLAVAAWTTGRVEPTSNGRLQFRQLVLDALYRLDDIGAGLALDVDDDGWLALVEAPDPAVFESIDHIGHISEQDRGSVAIGHDDVAVGIGCGELVVGGDGVGLVRAVERAFGAGDVRRDDHVAQVLERDAVIGEARQVRLDADGGADIALHGDTPHAGNFAEPLCQQGVRDVAERA